MYFHGLYVWGKPSLPSYLVYLVCLVSFVQPKNETDQTNQTNGLLMSATFSASCLWSALLRDSRSEGKSRNHLTALGE
jgi:hypothetical protein